MGWWDTLYIYTLMENFRKDGLRIGEKLLQHADFWMQGGPMTESELCGSHHWAKRKVKTRMCLKYKNGVQLSQMPKNSVRWLRWRTKAKRDEQ
jgi:hypothetical protein